MIVYISYYFPVFTMSTTSNSSTTKKVLEFADWNIKGHKYMVPKVNDKGGKSVSLISTQTSRSLHINTPLLMTWGIADFANDDGSSDGKFKISLNFPNPEYKTKDTDSFLNKMIEFQSQVVDDAVTNSELWFGKKKSKELVEDSFFPFVKYPKVKDAANKSTGVADTSRPPSISAKVPRYEDTDGTVRWECDLYDTQYKQIFPKDGSDVTPVDLVPKLSKIACTLQCTGIWVGGKGWGLSWKMISGVVKPKMVEAMRGVCHIKLSDADMEELEKPETDDIEEETVVAEPKTVFKEPVKEVIITEVEDSDNEEDSSVVEAPVVEAPKTVIKKVVKKKVAV